MTLVTRRACSGRGLRDGPAAVANGRRGAGHLRRPSSNDGRERAQHGHRLRVTIRPRCPSGRGPLETSLASATRKRIRQRSSFAVWYGNFDDRGDLLAQRADSLGRASSRPLCGSPQASAFRAASAETGFDPLDEVFESIPYANVVALVLAAGTPNSILRPTRLRPRSRRHPGRRHPPESARGVLAVRSRRAQRESLSPKGVGYALCSLSSERAVRRCRESRSSPRTGTRLRPASREAPRSMSQCAGSVRSRVARRTLRTRSTGLPSRSPDGCRKRLRGVTCAPPRRMAKGGRGARASSAARQCGGSRRRRVQACEGVPGRSGGREALDLQTPRPTQS